MHAIPQTVYAAHGLAMNSPKAFSANCYRGERALRRTSRMPPTPLNRVFEGMLARDGAAACSAFSASRLNAALLNRRRASSARMKAPAA
jgi:hypothetical protein